MSETASATQWVILATLIFNTLLSLYKDQRDRAWAREKDERDRLWNREDRIERERTAAVLAVGLTEHRAELASKVREEAALATARMVAESEKLGVKIDTNTEISTKAFHEANGAKELLAAEVRQRNQLALAAEAAAVARSTP